jgi:CDP-diacylglycerol--glycerol-3-phosphate 3-phosphatidyltransferase
MNPANLLTFARIALVPFFVFFLYRAGTQDGMGVDAWAALLIYVSAVLTDYADGYVARKLDMITPLGQFLDPLADKILVGGALLGLIAYRGFPIWAAVVIAVREVAIVWLRSAAMRRGNAMPASRHAKNKTAIQLVMVLAWLFPRTGTMSAVQDLSVYVAAAITVWSGLRYAVLSKQLLTPSLPKSEP